VTSLKTAAKETRDTGKFKKTRQFLIQRNALPNLRRWLTTSSRVISLSLVENAFATRRLAVLATRIAF